MARVQINKEIIILNENVVNFNNLYWNLIKKLSFVSHYRLRHYQFAHITKKYVTKNIFVFMEHSALIVIYRTIVR